MGGRGARAAVLLVALGFAIPLGACGESASSSAGTRRDGTPPEKSHYEAGEQSIERYGAEAKGSEREAVVSARTGYLAALGQGRLEDACGYLSESARRSLEEFANPRVRSRGCPAILAKLLPPGAAVEARQKSTGQIKQVRIKGASAFVVFHAPGARLYVDILVRESGGWRLNLVTSSVLAPALTR